MAGQQPDAEAVAEGQPGDRLAAPSALEKIEADAAGLISATAVGISLITAERLRQVAVKGYDAEHDAEHANGELIHAAVAYATDAAGATEEHTSAWWPFVPAGFKPAPEPLDSLVKAGALIAAEIDRIVAEEARRNG
jgi:hypothetical protein